MSAKKTPRPAVPFFTITERDAVNAARTRIRCSLTLLSRLVEATEADDTPKFNSDDANAIVDLTEVMKAEINRIDEAFDEADGRESAAR